ncbi:hypothetical protein GCM10020295_10150 [Streptomyces cinereospinus]
MQRGEEVVVAAGTRLDDGDAGGRVRDENVEQAVAALRHLPQEGLAVTGEVDDRLLGAGGDLEHSGGERVCHAPILPHAAGRPPVRPSGGRYAGSTPRDAR